MTRPKKNTVDYFPHSCLHGKTMFILEDRFGNDGYAAWFKILETLGSSEGHYIDCRNPAAWMFLQAKTRLTEDILRQIVDLLAKIEAIDSELWENEVIWCQNFVDGIADAYRNRKTEIPQKPSFLRQKPRNQDVSTPDNPATDEFYDQPTVRNPQTKLNETKLKRDLSRGDRISVPEIPPEPEPPSGPPPSAAESAPDSPFKKLNGKDFERFWETYPRKVGKPQARKAWDRILKSREFPGVEAVLAAIDRQKAWQQWTDDGGRFIPHAATWLNREGWNDLEPEPVTTLGKNAWADMDAWARS